MCCCLGRCTCCQAAALEVRARLLLVVPPRPGSCSTGCCWCPAGKSLRICALLAGRIASRSSYLCTGPSRRLREGCWSCYCSGAPLRPQPRWECQHSRRGCALGLARDASGRRGLLCSQAI